MFVIVVSFIFCTLANATVLMSGSSRVYPFAIVIAEEFAFKTKLHPPIVESVGTGGGFSVFCNGNHPNSPDIINASRKIKDSEQKECAKNGVEYQSVTIGLDAIVIAMHANNKTTINSLTDDELFKALARNIVRNGKIIPNPYQKWSDINPNLPNSDIIIYGPPSTSGTRDTFTKIVLATPCMKNKYFRLQYKKQLKSICSLMRNDGKFIETGENDAFIMHKISLRNGAVGIFGYSHYMENKHNINAIQINGVSINQQTIATSQYKIARPLFLYFKKHSLAIKTDVRLFYKEATSSEAIGVGGYLESYHLIPLDKEFLLNHQIKETDTIKNA